jgi:hypothetical protein
MFLKNIKINNMIQYIAIGLIGTGLWMAYEIYRAPMMDDNGNTTKEGKKISDLFKKKNKNK